MDDGYSRTVGAARNEVGQGGATVPTTGGRRGSLTFLWSFFPILLRAFLRLQGQLHRLCGGESLFVCLKLLVSAAKNLTLVWTSSVRSISGARDAKAVGFNQMRHRFDSPSPTSIGNSRRLNGRLQNVLSLVAPRGQHHEQRGEREKAHHVQN